MSKTGIVIAIDNEMATVDCLTESKCDTCPRRSKPGACSICSDFKDNSGLLIVAKNSIGANIGDKVRYGRAFSESLIIFLAIFVLPFLCAFISYFISVIFTDESAVMSKIALAVFVLSTAFSCYYIYKRSKKQCDYTIIDIIQPDLYN